MKLDNDTLDKLALVLTEAEKIAARDYEESDLDYRVRHLHDAFETLTLGLADTFGLVRTCEPDGWYWYYSRDDAL